MWCRLRKMRKFAFKRCEKCDCALCGKRTSQHSRLPPFLWSTLVVVITVNNGICCNALNGTSSSYHVTCEFFCPSSFEYAGRILNKITFCAVRKKKKKKKKKKNACMDPKLNSLSVWSFRPRTPEIACLCQEWLSECCFVVNPKFKNGAFNVSNKCRKSSQRRLLRKYDGK